MGAVRAVVRRLEQARHPSRGVSDPPPLSLLHRKEYTRSNREYRCQTSRPRTHLLLCSLQFQRACQVCTKSPGLDALHLGPPVAWSRKRHPQGYRVAASFSLLPSRKRSGEASEKGFTNRKKPLNLDQAALMPRGFGGSSAAARRWGQPQSQASTTLRRRRDAPGAHEELPGGRTPSRRRRDRKQTSRHRAPWPSSRRRAPRPSASPST